MNRLSPEAERLFQLAREADNPDTAQVDRVGRALSRRVAEAGALATGATLLSLSARATATLSVAKVVAAVTVVGALSTTGFYVLHSRKSPTTSIPVSVANTSVTLKLATSGSASEPGIDAQPVISNSGAVDASRSTPPRTPTRVAAVESPDPLQSETMDLQRAQAALRVGNSGLALRLLDAQDAKYRAGSLQQERSAARVLALCQIGNVTAARAESARFEKRWPNSPLAARVRAACGVAGDR